MRRKKSKIIVEKSEQSYEDEVILFIDSIAVATNKMLGTDYGFILGTHSPISNIPDMVSAGNFAGFKIWKKLSDDEVATKQIIAISKKDSLDQIITFLNKKD